MGTSKGGEKLGKREKRDGEEYCLNKIWGAPKKAYISANKGRVTSDKKKEDIHRVKSTKKIKKTHQKIFGTHVYKSSNSRGGKTMRKENMGERQAEQTTKKVQLNPFRTQEKTKRRKK